MKLSFHTFLSLFSMSNFLFSKGVSTKHRREVGLCYPKAYQEHYMRVFVKDEEKFDAALFALNETCRKFGEKFTKESKEDMAKAVSLSPMKDRGYSSQR